MTNHKSQIPTIVEQMKMEDEKFIIIMNDEYWMLNPEIVSDLRIGI